MSRSFTILKVRKANGTIASYTGGRYVSSTPLGASKKMFSQVKDRNGQKLTITLQEITQGSKRKIYTYLVKSIPQHRVVVRNGREIVYNSSVIAKSMN
jgi:uncharacterized protein (UPF0248 family)